jgi:hypothetical protein
MPVRPSSLKQLAFVHVKAKQGAAWAKRTVREYHGKTFGKLPLRVRRGKKK